MKENQSDKGTTCDQDDLTIRSLAGATLNPPTTLEDDFYHWANTQWVGDDEGGCRAVYQIRGGEPIGVGAKGVFGKDNVTHLAIIEISILSCVGRKKKLTFNPS